MQPKAATAGAPLSALMRRALPPPAAGVVKVVPEWAQASPPDTHCLATARTLAGGCRLGFRRPTALVIPSEPADSFRRVATRETGALAPIGASLVESNGTCETDFATDPGGLTGRAPGSAPHL